MSRSRLSWRISLLHPSSKAVIGLAISLTLSACVTGAGGATLSATRPPTAERPSSIRSEALIGRWGVASFRQEKDRQRVAAQARAQCKLPYTIARGPTGGVMMHVADNSALYELRPKGGGRQDLPWVKAPPGHVQDREILSISEREMVMRFVDPDANNRYGTFVYVRCAAWRARKRGNMRLFGRVDGAGPVIMALSAVFVMAVTATFAGLQPAAARSATETMDIGDEPGRISSEEATITDGPFARQVVFFRSTEAPGTLVVHTSERFIYVVMGNSRALRYGLGVGREGFQWSGLVKISRKAEWPDWTPPPEMIARQPYLPRFMAGGPGNPMGARALYLGSTIYRIHGTNQPETIGHAVSSGCFELANGDVIDLFDRVPVGTKVIIRHGPSV